MGSYFVYNCVNGDTFLGRRNGNEAVFCDKWYKPIFGKALYEETYAGIDRRGIPFHVVVPICPVDRGVVMDVLNYLGSRREEEDFYCNLLLDRFETVYPKYTIEAAEDFVSAIKKLGYLRVEGAMLRRQNCDEEWFSIAIPEEKVSATGSVRIEYDNGESDYVETSWLWENRERCHNPVVTYEAMQESTKEEW